MTGVAAGRGLVGDDPTDGGRTAANRTASGTGFGWSIWAPLCIAADTVSRGIAATTTGAAVDRALAVGTGLALGAGLAVGVGLTVGDGLALGTGVGCGVAVGTGSEVGLGSGSAIGNFSGAAFSASRGASASTGAEGLAGIGGFVVLTSPGLPDGITEGAGGASPNQATAAKSRRPTASSPAKRELFTGRCGGSTGLSEFVFGASGAGSAGRLSGLISAVVGTGLVVAESAIILLFSVSCRVGSRMGAV